MNPFQIEENIYVVKNGNIFKSKTEAIANPVNCVGVSGAGLAETFKRKYPDNYEAYKNYCEKGFLVIGECFTYDLGESKILPRWIINIPTKNHFKYPSKLEYVAKGLQGLIIDMKINGIKSVTLPKLGCGKGQLLWEDVKPIILNTFNKYKNLTCYICE